MVQLVMRQQENNDERKYFCGTIFGFIGNQLN